MAAYLDRMAGTATLKTAAISPLFAKHYRGRLRRAARGALIAALRGLAAAGLAPRRTVDRLRIPDLLGPGAAPVRTVVKSVSAHGRARAFAEAAPNARIVVILRDPWGYVASVIRGAAQGKYPAEAPLDWIPESPSGRRHGLTAARLSAMPPVERLTWNWIAINEQLLDDLAGRANVLHVRYDELCGQPMPQARRIFAFAGLPWHRQTEQFVTRSTSFRGTARYYAVFRDATEAPVRWRQELPPEDQRRVAEILRRSELARFCPALEA
jgi:Sulfotransferase family